MKAFTVPKSRERPVESVLDFRVWVWRHRLPNPKLARFEFFCLPKGPVKNLADRIVYSKILGGEFSLSILPPHFREVLGERKAKHKQKLETRYHHHTHYHYYHQNMAADKGDTQDGGNVNSSRRSSQSREFLKATSKGSDGDIDIPFASLEVSNCSKSSEINKQAMKAIKKYKSKNKARKASRRGLTAVKPTQLKDVFGTSSEDMDLITLKVFDKSEEEVALIRSTLGSNFFFDNLKKALF